MIDRAVPETSIVIRAFNEERWLPEVLAAVKSQTYTDYEILLVDSGSVDRTRDVAEANGARVIRLRSDDFTFGHSLNAGIQASNGRFIAVLSAHAIPTDAHWLEYLVAPLRDAETPMTFGRQRGHQLSKYSEVQDFERIYGPDMRRLRAPKYFANNANAALRRDAWTQHRFDEALTGLEDVAWAKHWMDLGKLVVYEPRACIWHIHTESWPQVRRRYHREGVAAHAIGLLDGRHTPLEIWREVRWCAADLAAAWGDSQLWSRFVEIVRFRLEKTAGLVGGIRDGRNFASPALRAEMYFDKTFPAVVIRGPGHAALETRAVPSLKPGEILVRVAFQGICHTDLEILDGTLGYYRSGMATYPIVPGHECAGTVAAVGSRVTEFAEHDRVVVECIQGCGECAECARDNAIACSSRREVGVIGHDGGYATFLVTRARYAHRIPDDISLAQAALVEPLAVVTKGLRRLGANVGNGRGKRCLVVGAGTIGHLAAKMLAVRGHDVTIVDREPARLALLGNGAVRTSTTIDDLTCYDWLVEATGNQETLELLLSRSATGATLLLLGLPYAQRSFSFETIVGFDRTVIGSVGSTSQDFDAAIRALPRIDTAPFLESAFPLDRFSEAWEAVRSRRYLKVMLRVDPTAT
jgi:2-desacetyl-2-hydroxyethyl bacteriochlorophyllide A dehydrogenase